MNGKRQRDKTPKVKSTTSQPGTDRSTTDQSGSTNDPKKKPATGSTKASTGRNAAKPKPVGSPGQEAPLTQSKAPQAPDATESEESTIAGVTGSALAASAEGAPGQPSAPEAGGNPPGETCTVTVLLNPDRTVRLTQVSHRSHPQKELIGWDAQEVLKTVVDYTEITVPVDVSNQVPPSPESSESTPKSVEAPKGESKSERDREIEPTLDAVANRVDAVRYTIGKLLTARWQALHPGSPMDISVTDRSLGSLCDRLLELIDPSDDSGVRAYPIDIEFPAIMQGLPATQPSEPPESEHATLGATASATRPEARPGPAQADEPVGGQAHLSNLVITDPAGQESYTVIAHDQAFTARLTLDATAVALQSDTPFLYAITVHAKAIGTGMQAIIGETRGMVTPGGTMEVEVAGSALMPGYYRVSATAVVDLAAAEPVDHIEYAAATQGTLLYVY